MQRSLQSARSSGLQSIRGLPLVSCLASGAIELLAMVTYLKAAIMARRMKTTYRRVCANPHYCLIVFLNKQQKTPYSCRFVFYKACRSLLAWNL